MAKLTKAQAREWRRLIEGMDADLGQLVEAGLVACSTQITVSGEALRILDDVRLTPAGRAALAQVKEG